MREWLESYVDLLVSLQRHNLYVVTQIDASNVRPLTKGGSKGAYEPPSSILMSPYSEACHPCMRAPAASIVCVGSKSHSRNVYTRSHVLVVCVCASDFPNPMSKLSYMQPLTLVVLDG